MNEEGIYTVDEFLSFISEVLVGHKAVVQGEITQLNVHPTGIYFCLKDKEEDSLLNCYLHPRAYRDLGIVIEEGMEVKAGGYARIYKRKGNLTFQVNTLELAGEGSLKKAYELLKQKLQEEGLFERKRTLPEYIGRIGIITSRTGAVIHDFRNNIAPFGFKLRFRDVRVEGVQAVENIVSAIQAFNREPILSDVLVIIRGGGSLEDLQPFNNELVARAIFASKIPTICGIGHDRDVPIASLVADYQCSTPTAAAHACSQSWDGVRQAVPRLQDRLLHAFASVLASRQASARTCGHRLLSQFNSLLVRHRMLSQRLGDMFAGHLQAAKEKVLAAGKYLAAASPERSLRLGYSIVTDASGRVIKDIAALQVGQEVKARLARGSFVAKVERKDHNDGHD